MRFPAWLSLLFVLPTAIGCAGSGADPIRTLRQLQALPYQQRQALANEAFASSPLRQANSDTVLYLHRGPGDDVRLVGDETAWEPGPRFRALPGTDFKYLLRTYAPRTRLDYKLVVDGRWTLDPLNKRTMMSGFGPNSEMRFRYDEPGWVRDERPVVPCRLDTLSLGAPGLGGVRTVVVAVPPGAASERRPFLLVHDGLEFLDLARLHECLASTEDVMTPIAVCVPPGQRTEEYAGALQATFARWVVEDLMPEIERRYADLGRTGEPWGAIGASYGGRIVLDVARRYPGRFDRLAPLSPSLTAAQLDYVRNVEPGSVCIYEVWGSYDIPRLIPDCEALAGILAERGIDHVAESWPQGHSWGLWRDVAEHALRFLYSDDIHSRSTAKAADPTHDELTHEARDPEAEDGRP